jgi:hypothetical protein
MKGRTNFEQEEKVKEEIARIEERIKKAEDFEYLHLVPLLLLLILSHAVLSHAVLSLSLSLSLS